MPDMATETRRLTAEEIETYRRDGVVCLRGVLSAEWVAQVKAAVDDAESRFATTPAGAALGLEPTLERSNLHAMNQLGEALDEMGEDVLRDCAAPSDTDAGADVAAEGEYLVVNNAVIDYPAVQQLATESPLGELAGQLFGSDKVNFIFDQIFIKQPGAVTRTAFHQDQGYFHVDGEQVASFWTAAEPVSKETGGMGYVKGSHHWDMHAPNVFVGQAVMDDHGLPTLPDIEGNEDDYDIVYFDVEPGDVIVHDYRLVHGSRGNTTLDRTRRAVSLRFAGDDARVLHRASAPAEFPFDAELQDGDHLDSTTYPVVWTR